MAWLVGTTVIKREYFKKMNAVAKAILDMIHAGGWVVTVSANDVTAVSKTTGERHIVRYQGDDLYPAVVELAVQLGFELEDG